MIRLKDKRRQDHLEAAFPGFYEALQRDGEQSLLRGTKMAVISAKNWKNEQAPYPPSGWVVGIPVDDLESYDTEYKPNRWNSWPETEPPVGALMIVEHMDEVDGHVDFRGFARYTYDKTFDEFEWLDESLELPVEVTRFRPWPTEENDEEAA